MINLNDTFDQFIFIATPINYEIKFVTSFKLIKDQKFVL